MIETFDAYLKSPTIAIVVSLLLSLAFPRIWKSVVSIFFQISKHLNNRLTEKLLIWELRNILLYRVEIKENRFIYTFQLINTKFLFWTIAGVGSYIFAIQAIYESFEGDPTRFVVWIFFFNCLVGVVRNAIRIAMSMALVENLERELGNNVANSEALVRRGYKLSSEYETMLSSARMKLSASEEGQEVFNVFE